MKMCHDVKQMALVCEEIILRKSQEISPLPVTKLQAN